MNVCERVAKCPQPDNSSFHRRKEAYPINQIKIKKLGQCWPGAEPNTARFWLSSRDFLIRSPPVTPKVTPVILEPFRSRTTHTRTLEQRYRIREWAAMGRPRAPGSGSRPSLTLFPAIARPGSSLSRCVEVGMLLTFPPFMKMV
jgi:hypothetical protein